MAQPQRRINIELLLGISATFLSLAALIVSIFQTRIAREQQQASVWPYLQTEIFTVNADDSTKDQLQFKLMNNGIGPALIKQVTVSFDEHSYQTHFAVFNTEINGNPLYTGTSEAFRTIDPGKIIKAGEEWTIYEVSQNRKAVQRVNQIVNDNSFHLKIRYSDVYGNCWQLDQNKVVALGKCPD